jgi:asparagine synthase (glutamine-hydrolysing)
MHQVAAQMTIFYKLPRILRKFLYYLVPKTADNLSTTSKLKEALRVSLLPKEEFYGEIGGSTIPKPDVYKKWTKEKLQELLALNNGNFTQSAIDFDLYYNTLADNFLTKVDRASMRVALEARPPLLDKRLIAFAHTIPTKRKVSWRKTKIIMRDIIQGTVPEEIRTRGKK